MTHTLSVYPAPEKGQFAIDVQQVVDVKLSADEAQKRCRIWLMDEINMGFVSGTPEFMIGEDGRAVWHIPIIRTAPHVGHVGEVGHVDMDVQTGEIVVEDDEIEMWYVRGDKLSHKIPPFKLLSLPDEMVPPPHLIAPVVKAME